MIIKSRIHDYSINIDDKLGIEQYFNDATAYFVIDKNVYELYRQEFVGINCDRLYLIEAIEDNKSIYKALEIVDEIVKMPSKRNTKLISIGGGIVQDITGFVANILYRGIYWLFIPTTLLAAADSCIGGKTSLNYGKFKNLLGTFYPPDYIRILPRMFKTLSERDLLSGLGEVVKFNIMGGEKNIEAIANDIQALIRCDDEVIERYLLRSLEFKKEYIEQDEFDKGKRILLNFAHTFGHAIETSSNYAIPHGTAVAIGTLVANNLSTMNGMLNEERRDKMQSVLEQIIRIDTKDINVDKIISAIKNDKKQTSNSIKAILMDNEYKLNIVDNLSEKDIIAAFSMTFAVINRL